MNEERRRLYEELDPTFVEDLITSQAHVAAVASWLRSLGRHVTVHPVRIRPSVEDMAAFSDNGPHRLLVARDGDRLAGWCSSQPYRTHPAFARTIETSVYAAPDAAGSGVGSALYARLFDDLAGLGLHRAVVGIALPNEPSVRLHARFGFRTVGVFDEYAHKNGRAISSQWMQRAMDGGTA